MSNPIITSKNLPQSNAVAMPRSELDDGVVAKPLQAPDFIGLKPKNPLHQLRWVVYDVGPGHSTRRFDECTAMGFVVAKADQLTLADGGPCPEGLSKEGGTKVIFGDVIAMLLAKKDYLGALKYNRERAISRSERSCVEAQGKRYVKEALSEINVPASVANKVSAFVPTKADDVRDAAAETKLELNKF